jgi:fructosamine-3-kinase
VAGGDINDAYWAELEDGAVAFVKTRAGAEEGEYETEAAGLRWLAEGDVAVPEVLAAGAGEGPQFLALEWVDSGSLSHEGAEAFGRGLAELHRLGAPAHGWVPGDGGVVRLGSIALDARSREEWGDVFVEQRLLPLARLCRDRKALDAKGVGAIERVCSRIGELAEPAEPPARLHGDLWSGNVHTGTSGDAWLIDPAAHGGHRETDLAMLRLFGPPGGGSRIFDAYEEAWPLADGAEERVDLWQLQPLLVHAALFGGHYGAEAERAASRYA